MAAPAGSKESRWIRKTGAVLSVVVGSAGVEGVADGELRGGGGLGGRVVLGLRWFSIKIEQGKGLTGGREGSWWREWRGGGPGGTGMAGAMVAVGIAGEDEDDSHPSIDGQGGTSGVV